MSLNGNFKLALCVCVEEIIGLVKFGSWEIIWLRGQLEQESVNLEPRIWNREKSVSSEVRTTVEFRTIHGTSSLSSEKRTSDKSLI